MKSLIGLIFIIVGLIPLIYWTIKEDTKIYFKIMIAAACGVSVLGGIFIGFII
jgi:hypothetical protein